jgi:hypothetical protein
MKKYKVTDNHIHLKPNIILKAKDDLYYFGDDIYVDIRIIYLWQKKGWIEEIEEPEFTRGDMLAAFIAAVNYYLQNESARYKFDEWIKTYQDNKINR